MEIEQAPVDANTEKPTGARRGLIFIHTGDGKGKTTAALGLALRAHGRGKKIRFLQFMKVGPARFGEHRAYAQMGLTIEGLGDGFSWKSKDLEHSAKLAQEAWSVAQEAIMSGDNFMVVLESDLPAHLRVDAFRAGHPVPKNPSTARACGAYRPSCPARAHRYRGHRNGNDAD